MEEKSEYIRINLEKTEKVFFSELLQDRSDIYDIVLTFVTLLELLSQGSITVMQEQMFDDMIIEWRGGL